MLIRDAELEGGRHDDVAVDDGRIVAIGDLSPGAGETVVDAAGNLLLPGLHDHHVHLAAQAAALASIPCGPPQVNDLDDLAAALCRPGRSWLRGIGYHECVAGLLDTATLDRIAPDRPVRIQHRGGRMWFLNSAALDLLLAHGNAPIGLDRATGRLFDDDGWLRRTLPGRPPALAEVGAMLARRGVTGVTDMTPANDADAARYLAAEQSTGALPQKMLLAGRPSLAESDMGPTMRLGPVKLHLHEAALPDYDVLIASIAGAHALHRAVAIHCVTEVELVFALAALAAAGSEAGDRIEHAALAPDSAVAEIARLGLAVVSQPHFIAERGDQYRRDVAIDDQPLLYRLRAFSSAGVPLAAGSDAPFGGVDPWASMAAAVSRHAASGVSIGPSEALSPEQALDLYLADPKALDQRRRLSVGAPADLCLLDCNWRDARRDLAAVGVDATWIDGRPVHDLVDQPPA